MGEGRTLLILGDPGAGKTTMLLKLTRDLITQTEQDLNRPIPVVFNLSSWANKQQKIAAWLVDELQSHYGVSKSLGKAWVHDQQLLLLLDGLDEVKAKYRETCVQAINQFMQNYGLTEIVVCSRIKDYEALSTLLQLRNAIYVQPLTAEQINQYLDKTGEQLQGVKTLLQEDTAMQEMMKSPLIMSIVSLAYKDLSVENLQQFGSSEERRSHLFNTYIEQMFKRHGRSMREKYTPEQTKHWLTWLATRMVQESQTLFLIEKIQPAWLQRRADHIFYRIASGFTCGVVSGLIFGILFGPLSIIIKKEIFTMRFEMREWVRLALIFGILFGTVFGLFESEIQTIDTFKWSAKEFRKYIIRGRLFGLTIGLVLGATVALILHKTNGLIIGLIVGHICGLIYTIIQGFKEPEIKGEKLPNQGIKKSAFNAFLLGIMSFPVAGLVGVVIGELEDKFKVINDGLQWERFAFLGISGLVMGLCHGGEQACIQHFIFRLILYKKGLIPWNYARFLDYAKELIFLQKVGGGYIFIHRMLLEHFSQVKPEQTPESPVRVSQSIDLLNTPTVQASSPGSSEEVETSQTVETLESELVKNKICGNCQHENLPKFNFCSKCGTALNK